jgi:hypothetical protein
VLADRADYINEATFDDVTSCISHPVEIHAASSEPLRRLHEPRDQQDDQFQDHNSWDIHFSSSFEA